MFRFLFNRRQFKLLSLISSVDFIFFFYFLKSRFLLFLYVFPFKISSLSINWWQNRSIIEFYKKQLKQKINNKLIDQI